VVPNLPDAPLQSFRMGFFASRIIVFFFSYEILIGELRGETKKVGFTLIAALVAFSIRGLFQFLG
jgi:UDP-GlcNAc:undecaprenyl-phosphate GlcNAc-1-phosphate transferase